MQTYTITISDEQRVLIMEALDNLVGVKAGDLAEKFEELAKNEDTFTYRYGRRSDGLTHDFTIDEL